MAGQKGRLFVLKVEDSAGAGTYTQVGGLQATSFTINNGEVDITNKSSSGWRQLLEGAGTQSVDITGSGVFTDDVAANVVRSAAETNDIINFQLDSPGDTYPLTITGAFQITAYNSAGGHEDAVNFDITLHSASQVTFS